MKRNLHWVKSVAKVLSPLILSLIVLLSAYAALNAVLGPTLGAAGLFLGSGAEVKAPEGDNIFEGYEEPPTPVDAVDGNDIRFPHRGDLYARLAIPSCGIEDDVYFDDSDAALRRGLGQYYGSSIPGYGAPILIAGHNNGSFHRLGGAAVGDEITITTNYGVYVYRITEARVRRADDPAAIDLAQEKEQLILYTCYPFTTLSLTPQRYFVYADKVSGPTVLH